MTESKTVKLPSFSRSFSFLPNSFNAQDRTIEVVFSTGSRVLRRGWTEDFYEELSLDPKSVRLARLNGGAPVLNNHNANSLEDVIGTVDSARVDGKQGIAKLRFSSRADVAPIVQDIADGIIRNVSVGYMVHKFDESKVEGDLRVFRATDWEPMEISMVGIPADAGSVTRGSEQLANCEFVFRNSEKETEIMKVKNEKGDVAPVAQEGKVLTRTAEAAAAESVTESTEEKPEGEKPSEESSKETPADEATPAPVDAEKKEVEAPAAEEKKDEARSADAVTTMAVTAERARSLEITKICDKHKLDRNFATGLIEKGVSVDEARALIIDKLAERETTETRNVTVNSGDGMERQVRMQGAANAICHRVDSGKNQLTDAGREFAGLSLIEIARDFVEASGTKTRGMAKMEIAKRALHSSGDFPLLLADVANKFLRDAYAAAPQTWLPLVRQVTVSDFKDIKRIQLGDAPSLEKKLENGEYKRGTVSEAQEKYKLANYGKIVGFSREMLINDDLSAFTRMPELMGRAAKDLESDLVWAIITANAAMSDAVALFHASHGNLAAVAAAIDIAPLGIGRAAMRSQVGLNGRLLNIAPNYLIVPAALETKADQFVTQITPALSGSVNPFAGRLQVIAEPRLDANSATAWYLAAQVGAIDIIELARLEGENGPVIEQEFEFDTDGIEMKVRMDIGVKAIDYRGLFKNAGV